MRYIAALGASVVVLFLAAQFLFSGLLLMAPGAPAQATRPELRHRAVPNTPLAPRRVPWALDATPKPEAAATTALMPRKFFRSLIPLEVRAKPGTEGRRLGFLKAGQPIEVVDEEGDWAKFVGPTGRTSWVDRTQLVPLAQ